MALSMDEERILTEIASRLSQDDPALAQRLESFGGPEGTPRRRIIAAVLVVVFGVVAALAAAVAILLSQ
ncbi:DUF3040 domain-containing protein [Actinocorallia sp. B10E7]|uniref:DUF3040 domain-containing protein n=1 Tax=Actinocorallia sp. B10E7 TaxID=3153558 RepID=UPI00325E48C3